MRLLVHDYAGHPFQVQLSRGFAERGHDVLHLFSESFQTPHGELQRRDDDPPQFQVHGVRLEEQIQKYNYFHRFQSESKYATLLTAECEKFDPDVVLSANTPSIVQDKLAAYCQTHAIRLVSWIQDMYGLAAYRILKKRLPLLGHLIGQYFMRLDRRSAQRSDQVVVITEDFVPKFERMGIPSSRIHAVHNWAPLADLPVGNRDNEWSSSQGLGQPLRFIYSGTLSIRHNPDLLLQLAKRLDEWGNAELIVISEGAGIDWLKEKAEETGVQSLRCLAFQPFEAMQHVFASADVLVAILEPDAGVFCVPSKVLSYMCAQRPLLLAMPRENLAARIAQQNEAGLVVEPHELDEFVAAARRFYDDEKMRSRCGQAARAYAEQHFEFDTICDRFCEILGLESSTPSRSSQSEARVPSGVSGA